MAELDDRLLKTLDATLQNMNQHLQTLEQTLSSVGSSMRTAFDPSALREWSNAMRGMKAARLIDAESIKDVEQIKTVFNDISILRKEISLGKGFRLFSEGELNQARTQLAEIQDTIALLNNMSKAGKLVDSDYAYLGELRAQRDILKQQVSMGGAFDVTLNEEDMRRRIELLARYKQERDNLLKGEQQRGAELANIKKKEEQAEETALRKAMANVKRQIDAKTQLTRIEHEREERARIGSKLTEQQIDAENRKYQALEETIQRLISQGYKQFGDAVMGQAYLNNKPYEFYSQAQEDQRHLAQLQNIEEQQKKNTKETEKQNKALRDVEMTAQRLKSALAAAFGIYQLRSFISNMVKIRGEFEMSEVALGNILGNSEKTQLIWKKTMNLAVNSPLTAQQLTRYVKQLAAFRVETSKLYDTTKMLGDVAVGLGVDMERLILAYGHTRSSGFLRGMYARQFATAGVNIYGELADYYSQLEGRMVSFKEVYERISKKMVSFADVEKVFEKITSKGGTFYNMQEELTDTVQGQINKIKDSWQQAMNELGKGDQGVIRTITDLILNLVKNWRLWISVIKASVTALVSFKAINIASALLSTSYAANVASKSTLRLASAMKTLGKSVYKNWKALVISLAAAGVVYMVDAARNVKKFNEDIDEQTVKLYEAQQKINEYRKSVDANNEVLKNSSSTEEELKLARESNLGIINKLQTEYPELYDGVTQLANGEVILTEKLDAHNQSLREQIRLTDQLKQKNFADDSFETDTREYFDQLSEWRKEIERTQFELKLKLAHGGIDKDEDDLVSAILGIDTSDILLAIKQYNDIINTARGTIEEGVSELEKTYRNALHELSKLPNSSENSQQMNELRGRLDRNKLWNEAAKVAGLYDVGKFVPINTNVHAVREFNKESNEMVRQLVDGFELAVRDIDEEQKKISDKYNERLRLYLEQTGKTTEAELDKETKEALNIQAFADYFRENSDHLLEMVKDGTIDVNDTIRTFLEEHGQALTEENKRVWNTILNDAITGSSALDEALGMLEKSWVQNSPFLKKIWEERAATLRGTQYDFFASFKKESGGGEENDLDKSSKTYKSLDDLLSLLKTMNSEYEKLSKSAYGFSKSQKTVMDVFRESFKDVFKTTSGLNKLDDVLTMINFNTLDITSKSGLASAFKELYDFMEKNNLWGQFGKDADKLRAKLQKTIDMQEVEVGMDLQVKIREDFAKKMEDMLNNYQLTVELQELKIDENMAKEWLGAAYTTLGDILEEANAFANGLIESGNFDTDDLEKYKQYVDKVEDEILKTRKEKTKEYSKYLEKELSERAKKEMEFAIKSAEVQGAQIFTEDQKQAILSNMEDDYTKAMQELTWKSFKESTFYVEMMDDLASIPATYSSLMLAKINELLMSPQVLSPRAFKEAINARQKILEAQMQLKPLRTMLANRDLVNAVFADESLGLKKRGTMGGKRRELDKEILSRTENIDKLEKEAKQYAHLTAQVEAYEKAETRANNAMKNVGLTLEGATGESVQSEIDDRKNRLDLLKQEEERYKELKEIQGAGELTDAQQSELKELANNVNVRKKEIEGLEAEIKLLGEAKQAVLSYRSALALLGQPENEDALTILSGGDVTTVGGNVVNKRNLSNQQQENKNQLKNQKKALQSLKGARKGTIEWVKAWHEFNSQLNTTIGKVKNMGNAFYDTYEALGGETDALTEGWKEFGNTMIDAITSALTMIPTLVTGFTAAGVAINSAMGIIGLIAEAIQLVLVLITGLAKLHDARYEKEIEIQQKKIDELERAYERLEKQIEKTWDTISYMKVYNDETQNLYEQIQALNAQMNAEESKKNVDKDKIQDYKDKIQDAEDELEELAQKQIEVFGGIGKEGYRDAAQGFVDAWKSAFLETGDGLQGLQDHFDEFLNEWFVKQATMRVAGKMLEPLFRDIDNAVDKYSGGGTSVMMSELAKIRERFGIIAPQLSDTLDELSGLWGIGGEGGLSGLAAGIQGMTEEQANVLEAYWNSVRGYTANIDMNVSRIAQILGAGGDNANPMLHEMELIAQNTSNIRELLNTVSYSGGEGVGIRVYSY